MENFITKSKYFNESFNTAIFSDPIRIYFSHEHEAHALEIYSHMQKRKDQWESYLSRQDGGKYCYIMLYADREQYAQCFDAQTTSYAPGEFGSDFVVGVNGPLNPTELDSFLVSLDEAVIPAVS